MVPYLFERIGTLLKCGLMNIAGQKLAVQTSMGYNVQGLYSRQKGPKLTYSNVHRIGKLLGHRM